MCEKRDFIAPLLTLAAIWLYFCCHMRSFLSDGVASDRSVHSLHGAEEWNHPSVLISSIIAEGGYRNLTAIFHGPWRLFSDKCERNWPIKSQLFLWISKLVTVGITPRRCSFEMKQKQCLELGDGSHRNGQQRGGRTNSASQLSRRPPTDLFHITPPVWLPSPP